MANDKDKVHVDPDELSAALDEMSESSTTYVHVFKKPLQYNGQEILSVSFDFEKLTGKDGLEIERELQALGKVAVVPALSGEYAIRMASRASTPKIGADAFPTMSLRDYNKIRSMARSFLLASEQ